MLQSTTSQETTVQPLHVTEIHALALQSHIQFKKLVTKSYIYPQKALKKVFLARL